jgi:hypothetical protein
MYRSATGSSSGAGVALTLLTWKLAARRAVRKAENFIFTISTCLVVVARFMSLVVVV